MSINISPRSSVFVLAGAQIDLVAADNGLLGISLAPGWEAVALGNAFDMRSIFADFFRDDRCRRGVAGASRPLPPDLHRPTRRTERLAEFGAVAIEGVGLQAETPGQEIRVLAILYRGAVRHVDGFGNRAGNERLRRRHHANVALRGEIPLADPAAQGLAQSKTGRCSSFRYGRAFQGHRAAAIGVRGVDILFRETEMAEQVEAQIIEQRIGKPRVP